MLYAAPDTSATPAPTTVPAPPGFIERVKGYASGAKQFVTVYAPKAERIIDAPVYDASAALGVDVIWLGGVLITLKLISMGLYWEFFRGKGTCSCPLPHSL